ncbi:IQ domain-containing protein IQM2-like [Neltuma alba]|uniref:IQ domain-containing protein IQM2-like n=1 Tax=Neltuma alba TaxID=207710 RepID=UPI0010A31AC5|nr:IQ domain-containing protein IQM2-like [Prosopis alba]
MRDLVCHRAMIWKFVGSVSGIAGLVCFGFSSTYKISFGKLGIGGLLLYLFVGVIIWSLILWGKRIRVSEKFRGPVAALIFDVICLISAVNEKLLPAKSDALSIISYGSFALMSLSMSRKFELGFETGFSTFFLTLFATQLFKINWILLPIALVFCSLIVILRHYSESVVQEVGPISPSDHLHVDVGPSDGNEWQDSSGVGEVSGQSQLSRRGGVGKGLYKNEKAQRLARRHWLEAVDPCHRYGHNILLYYNVWHRSQSSQPFFYWLDVGEGKEVNLERCPRSKLQHQCVKYLGPKEREEYEVIVEGGKLVYRQDVPAVAGRLAAHEGVLKVIWLDSAYYLPTVESFREVISFLEEHNLDPSAVISKKTLARFGLAHTHTTRAEIENRRQMRKADLRENDEGDEAKDSNSVTSLGTFRKKSNVVPP